VYLFEQGPAQLPAADGKPRGRQYLGEFRVRDAAAQQATLVPVNPLDGFEQQRLAASRAPWVIYETMPSDRHEIFAGMTEEQLKQRIPAKSVQEYIRHGKEATPDDDEARQVGYDADGKRLPPNQLANAAKRLYQRRLRDYATEFDELTRRRVEMDVARAEIQADIARLTAAVASAKELQAFREDELRRLRSDLAGIQKERQAIEQHLAQVEQQVARARQLLAETLRHNSELVRRLAGEDRTTRAIEGNPAHAQPAISVALGAAN
jgi:chromosome segregation ATPase